MTEERKHAILLATVILTARKLQPLLEEDDRVPWLAANPHLNIAFLKDRSRGWLPSTPACGYPAIGYLGRGFAKKLRSFFTIHLLGKCPARGFYHGLEMKKPSVQLKAAASK
jgi:hypothetical protein